MTTPPEDDFPTRPDNLNDRPTDPSPPPEAYELDEPFASGDSVAAAVDSACRKLDAMNVVTAHALKVVGGAIVPATRHESAKRDWLDWGKDTGPRLRVKGLVDPPKPPPTDPDDGAGAGGWRERHAALKRARSEGDNATISRIMQKPLDELHSTSSDSPPVPPLDWDELEPALVAELREWAKAHNLKPGSVGLQRYLDASCAVRMRMADGMFEARVDRVAVKTAWFFGQGKPRSAAARLVRRVADELAAARRREIITVPDPELQQP